jgi:hypothetical protein
LAPDCRCFLQFFSTLNTPESASRAMVATATVRPSNYYPRGADQHVLCQPSSPYRGLSPSGAGA